MSRSPFAWLRIIVYVGGSEGKARRDSSVYHLRRRVGGCVSRTVVVAQQMGHTNKGARCGTWEGAACMCVEGAPVLLLVLP